MIQEDYCSFEVAKLLKEKGFDAECRAAYTNYGKLFTTQIQQYITNILCDKGYLWDCTAPTLQMVMKWLREKSIYIYVEPFITISSEGYNLEGYKPWVTTFKRNWFNPLNELGKVATQSYEEAVEAALKYSLENLI